MTKWFDRKDEHDGQTTDAERRRGLPDAGSEDEDQLLPQLVAHLREHRTRLRRGVGQPDPATRTCCEAMTPQEMAAETTSVYDNYVEVLETGSVEALQHYARDLSERIIPRGVETHEVVGIVLLLRDVLARSLFEKYQGDFASAQPGARRLRAGRQPHRQHGGGQLRRRAGAGHPAAAGLDPRAVHAGAAGAGAAAHPADHRRAGQRARPPADRAAAHAASAPTGPRSSSSTSPAPRTSTRRSPTTSCRPSTRPG